MVKRTTRSNRVVVIVFIRIIISSIISVAIYSGILLPSAVRDFVAILWMSS